MRLERGQKPGWLRSGKLCKKCSFYWHYYVGHRQSLGRAIGIEEVAGFYGLQRKKSCPKMQVGASVGLSLGLWLGTKPGLSSQGLLDSGFDEICNGTVGEYGPGLAVLKG